MDNIRSAAPPDPSSSGITIPTRRVFAEFLRLGLTSFGGPVAHIGYFRDRFVRQLGWLDEVAFADLVALCQFLPGPASSQLGMAIGQEKAGLGGALAAFVGFTLPSAVIMALLAFGFVVGGAPLDQGVLSGLAIVAVAVVAEAVRGMALSLARGPLAATIAVTATAIALLIPGGFAQIAILIAGGAVGAMLATATPPPATALPPHGLSRRAGAALLFLFGVLLIGLPVLAAATGSTLTAFLSGLYRAGALVFGGGHVVLPLLQDAMVGQGFVSEQAFVAGYGAAQAMPGPLFSFSAWLGVSAGLPNVVGGAILAVLALFAPAFLLVVGAMPYWQGLRRVAAVRRALVGVNAAVVGLLAAALYDPVFTTAIHGWRDMALAFACYGLLAVLRLPSWLVVLFAAVGGWALVHVFG
jgi:chromate transporter